VLCLVFQLNLGDHVTWKEPTQELASADTSVHNHLSEVGQSGELLMGPDNVLKINQV
jgi:hypothetical protein